VIQQRREDRTEPESQPVEVSYEQRIAALEQRVEQLEALLEGFQDSVHREMTRQDRHLAALAEKTEPHEMTRAIGKYSQERGL
jgi:uncharacterized coiled-coil protein SlyX